MNKNYYYVSSAIRMALTGSAAILVPLLSMLPFVHAQDAEPIVEEVYVTGSSIKRVEHEGALPIQILSELEIARSGVSNAGELIAKLPAMQGFTTPADSNGGPGGGILTASLRALGSEYTLVLLNGRRMAPADSGSAIDLSNIPVSAIERVDVLTDGAGALYGSDAVAGVVNFVLKSNVQGTTISGRADRPQESGGESASLDITTGFGDLQSDGFNIMVSLSHDEQGQLAAQDREFAKTGIINFTHPELQERVLFFNGSGNSIPGNARVRYTDGADEETLIFNPYFLANGETCPPQTSQVDRECWFDYTSTIELVPEYERNTIFSQATLNITDDLEGKLSAFHSSNELTARIAPYPTGYVRLYDAAAGGAVPQVVQDEVLPHLTQDQIDNLSVVDGRWRALPAEGRTTEYNTDSTHIVFGLEGNFSVIDYNSGITYAVTETEQNYPTGWLIREPFQAAARSGAFNMFAGQESFTDSDRQSLVPTVYRGNWDNTKITLMAMDSTSSISLFALPGGDAQAAVGFDVRRTIYERTVSAANANQDLLFLAPDTPYELERDQYAHFTEVFLPITPGLEITGSLRYDHIGGVSDELNNRKVNDSDSDVTYKISSLWRAADFLAIRASYGTGFKAPTMRQIGEPRSDFGVTGGNFTCPFPDGDPLAQYCLSGASQYGVYREGYAELKSEKSTQYSVGFVLTPTDDISLTVDYWNIEMEDLVERLQEAQIFANPDQYRDLFSTRLNQSTQEQELAIIQAAVNAGTAESSGVDYKLRSAVDLGFGTLGMTLGGTYFIESENSLTGSSLGRFGDDDEVVFRSIVRGTIDLEHGNFSHSLGVNSRSGYTDQAQVVELIDQGNAAADIQLEIPTYTTIDWQSSYRLFSDKLTLAIGVNNLADEAPPLSLRTSGAGHQIGWDPRYTDAFGRTVYGKWSFSF